MLPPKSDKIRLTSGKKEDSATIVNGIASLLKTNVGSRLVLV